jgi:hypothetical protein
MFSKIIRVLLVVSLIIYLLLLIVKPKLPGLPQIQKPVLDRDPLQQTVNISPFKTAYGKFTYEITPLYSYEIYGIVVSEYSSHNWLDLSHKKDPANTRDLCLTWGDNISSGAYQKVKYSHGEFTCYYSYRVNFDPPFNGQNLSNNHLIPKNQDVEKKIGRVNIGDQVRISGYLANYKITDENGRESASRNTSITRQDSRNGACEIIYVTDIEVIERSNIIYFALKKYLPFLIISLSGLGILKFLFF